MRQVARLFGVIGGMFGVVCGLLLGLVLVLVVFVLRNPFPIIGPQPKLGVIIVLAILATVFLVAGLAGFAAGALAVKEPRRAGQIQITLGLGLILLAVYGLTLLPVLGLIIGGWAGLHLLGGVLALLDAPRYEPVRRRGRGRGRRNPFFD